MISFCGTAILEVITTLSNTHGKGYNPDTHLVYPVHSEQVVVRANGKQKTLFGAREKVIPETIIKKVRGSASIDFIVVRVDTPSALKQKNVGGSFPHSQIVDIKKTAIGMVVSKCRRTIETIAKSQFDNTRGFIKLCLPQDKLRLPQAAASLLENFGTIRKIIEDLVSELDCEEATQLGLLKPLIWKALNEMTEAYFGGRCQQNLPQTSATSASVSSILVSPQVFVQQKLNVLGTPDIWAFLDPEDKKQLVFSTSKEGGIICMNLTEFDDCQIRNQVSLIAQVDFEAKIAKEDIFVVSRYSSAVGTKELGKYLIGKIKGESKDIKLPHTVFTLKDNKSPGTSSQES